MHKTFPNPPTDNNPSSLYMPITLDFHYDMLNMLACVATGITKIVLVESQPSEHGSPNNLLLFVLQGYILALYM